MLHLGSGAMTSGKVTVVKRSLWASGYLAMSARYSVAETGETEAEAVAKLQKIIKIMDDIRQLPEYQLRYPKDKP